MSHQIPSVPLHEVCQIEKSQDHYTGLPYVGLEDIESGTGRFLGSIAPADVKSTTFCFSDEHVLYGRLRPYLNKVFLPDFEGHCSTEIFPLKTKSGLMREFLAYWLMSDTVVRDINDTSTGARMPRANMNAVLDFLIPLPSVTQQKRIVAKLDEAFAAIAKAKENAEKNVANARAIFESELNAIFSKKGEGWEEKRLEDVCGITSALIDPREAKFHDLVHVGAGNIASNTGVISGLMTAQEEGLISGKFTFDESVVLYSKIRPYLMKVARPGFNGICSADVYPLTPVSGKITRDFLFYLLLSKPFTDYAIQGSARAGMPKVNRNHLFAYKAMLPSVSEQNAIAGNLDALTNETNWLGSIYQRKLSELDALKQSILHHAFSGQV